MPLRLRRAADQFRRAHWEHSNEHLVILSGETVVGSLMRHGAGLGHLMTMLEVLKSYSFEERLGSAMILREPVGVVGMVTPWTRQVATPPGWSQVRMCIGARL